MSTIDNEYPIVRNGEIYKFRNIDGLVKSLAKRDFQWTYSGIVSKEEAETLQKLAGYNPMGYGFFDYRVVDSITTWKSQNTCD